MNKINKLIMIIVGLSFPLLLFSQNEKIFLQKTIINSNFVSEKKVHPFQSYFDEQRQSYIPDTKSSNFNRLLVLLVDFQEDENPNTTGNGKFITEIDPDFPITIGSPPYNREFFEAQLEAMKYYYRAVSFEAYQLEYDVYPKNKQAYTLPYEMAYYNPAEPGLFISRIEQYFQDVFVVADQDDDRPDSFGYYGHYMIIHAGSDWQHDVLGDSFHDIPSFFINIGSGKEVIVDNGQHMIKNAANVPEYITQDVREVTDRYGNTFVSGYGAVNAVFAHEFGHSLGFVDLYNTLSNRPAVGSFDIMDSGGSGILTDYQNGKYYYIEGALPTLPSVWSRLIPFEDNFLRRNILVDLSKAQPSTELQILATSTIRKENEYSPYFYRIRLSDDEYILIENRNLDPDKDGETILEGALNRRVVLHPTLRNIDGAFTYEYDLLLPSWQDSQMRSHGGGLLIWHIDDKQIFHEGEIIDGVFYSNFDRNRVNTNIHGNKAVRIIEADNLNDIGNPYSYFWTGTAYEYFFKYKPVIDFDGIFVSWSDEIHNDELSFFTKPSLKTNSDKPSSWKISDISMADRLMTFQISNSMFEYTSHIGMFPNLYSISNEASLLKHQLGQISILSDQGLFFYSHENVPPSWIFYWEENEINEQVDFDIITTNFRQSDLQEYLLVYGNKIIILDGNFILEWEFDGLITQTPMNFNSQNESFLALTFDDRSAIYKVDNQQTGLKLELITSISETGKFVADRNNLFLLTKSKLYNLDLKNLSTDSKFNPSSVLPEFFTIYEPVIYEYNNRSTLFIMSDDFNIYRCNEDGVTKIFDIKKVSNEIPSNLALGFLPTMNTNFVLFHTQTKVFLLSEDGSYYPNFPVSLENTTLIPESHSYIFQVNGEIIFMLNDSKQGLMGMDIDGKIRHDYSQYWNKGKLNAQFFIEKINNYLVMIYSDNENNVFSGALKISNEDKILWNSFRNNSNGSIRRTGEIMTNPVTGVQVFVYPNPVNQSLGNIRIINSSSKADIKIYNIAGQLIVSDKIEESSESFRDYRFQTSKLSSGIYFVNVNIDGKSFIDKFSIIK